LFYDILYALVNLSPERMILRVGLSLLKDRLWRKTRSKHPNPKVKCRGVDPNRNWDFHWGGEEQSLSGVSRFPK